MFDKNVQNVLKHLGLVKSELPVLEANIVSNEKKMLALENAPLTRDEYLGQLHQAVDSTGAKYHHNIKNRISQLPVATDDFDLFTLFSTANSLSSEAFCYFCSKQIKENLELLVDDFSIEFGKVKKPEIDKKIAALTKKIKKDKSELEEIKNNLLSINTASKRSS